MTDTEHSAGPRRRVHFSGADAPAATVVAPSVAVAVRDHGQRLLLVRRRDSGTWELPGGRVEVGESAAMAAVRETAEESGVRVRITGLVGLLTDPAYVVEAARGGEVRQQFTVCLRAEVLSGRPEPDLQETIDAAWFDPVVVALLPMEPGARVLIRGAMSAGSEPHLG